MTRKQKKRIGTILTVLAVIVCLILGKSLKKQLLA